MGGWVRQETKGVGVRRAYEGGGGAVRCNGWEFYLCVHFLLTTKFKGVVQMLGSNNYCSFGYVWLLTATVLNWYRAQKVTWPKLLDNQTISLIYIFTKICLHKILKLNSLYVIKLITILSSVTVFHYIIL